MKSYWIVLLVIGGMGGCASSSNEGGRRPATAHPAAYSQDHFTFNKPQKKREDNDFDFYYKHCSVEERKPFPTGAIWQCTYP